MIHDFGPMGLPCPKWTDASPLAQTEPKGSERWLHSVQMAQNVGRSVVSDPHWYKDAVIYELHVRAFFDSNGDGIGDFQGLTQKLDYLADLGVTALWLLPFYPSPLQGRRLRHRRLHGASTRATARCATSRRSSARRTSAACASSPSWSATTRPTSTPGSSAPGARHRAAPRATSTSGATRRTLYQDARIIFKDFETSNWTWDPVAEPVLLASLLLASARPEFRKSRGPRGHASRALDFWLDMGVDGLRLDAVPYLYEREGTNCENLPETHEFLRELRAHIDEHYSGPHAAGRGQPVARGRGRVFRQRRRVPHGFHFPLMPRMFMAMRMEDRFPIVDILEQTPAIPDNCQWALFLRNHDELTLEMVTDEERDYMYRVYAHDPQMRINLGIRRRLAPLLGNNRRRIELMNGLLFALPGTPVIYYGDEIGMGDNIYLGDRNGVRTPMQWSADRNAGFSSANPQRLFLPVIIDPEYHYEAINVEAQQNNPHSLLWWMKRLIALRKHYRAFGRGSLDVPASGEPAHCSPSSANTRTSGSSSWRTCRVSCSTPTWTSPPTAAWSPWR